VGTRQVNVYRKPSNAGTRGAMGGWRRDAEAIYLIGPWSTGLGGQTSIIATGARSQGGPVSAQSRYGHPHAKPVDVMETLISHCPPGTVAGPVRRLGLDTRRRPQPGPAGDRRGDRRAVLRTDRPAAAAGRADV